MAIINAFTGVSMAGVATLHVSEAIAAAAHPAAAAMTPRKRHTGTATVASVNWGTI